MKSSKNTNEEAKVCSLCFLTTGTGEKLRQLPNGSWAQGSCISRKFCQDIVAPIRQTIPGLPKISVDPVPEITVNRFLQAISDIPMEIVGTTIQAIDSFSRRILGKSIQPGGFLKTY